MDNMQPYDDLKRRQQAAAAASYIQSSDENPDEVADNLNFAREYAQRTGNPLPTQQLVKEYRPMFQRLMDETRDRVPLSTARKTATWYGENPMAILLAKDDVYNLCSFEEMVQRFGQVPQAFGDVKLPERTQASPPANPETPLSESPAGRAVPQQAPAPNPVAPGTQPPGPAGEDAGSLPQPATPPADPAGSNGSLSDPLAAQPGVPPASPAAPATGEAPAVVQDTRSDETKAKDALIEEIADAAKLTDEQAYALLQKILSQDALDSFNAKFYLDAVRTNAATREDVFKYLAHSSSPAVKRTEEFGQNLVEVPKGVASTVVTGTGRIIEGAGQLMAIPKSEQELARIENISKAAGLSDRDYALLDTELGKLPESEAAFSRRVLRQVRAGALTPEQAKAEFYSTFQNFSRFLQSSGASVGDYGENLFPAAPGYENSWGRMTGEILGASLPNVLVTVTVGGLAGTGVEFLRAAGDGAAAARKANRSESDQSLAAWTYAPTAFIDKLPFDRLSSPVLTRPHLNSSLEKWAGIGFKESSAQATQLFAQNLIAHHLIDPKQEAFDKVADTFVTGGIAGIGKEIIQDAATVSLRMLTRGRGSLRLSMSRPEAAIKARQDLDDIAATVEASKYRARDPEGHRDFTANVLKDTPAEHAYASHEAVEKYSNATGRDPSGKIGTHDAQVAKDTGSDLKIPMAAYLPHSTGSKADADFRDSMRFGADALNSSEALASHVAAPARPPAPTGKQSNATGKDPSGKIGTHDAPVAKDTGSDLKIPMADDRPPSTGSKANVDFKDSMRLDADALNSSTALASLMAAPVRPPAPTGKRSDSNFKPIFPGDRRLGEGAPGSYLEKTMARPANSGNTHRDPSGLSIKSLRQTLNR